jgi:hypothetical protein
MYRFWLRILHQFQFLYDFSVTRQLRIGLIGKPSMPSDRPVSSDKNRLAKPAGDKDGSRRRSRPSGRRDQLSIPSDKLLTSDEGFPAEHIENNDEMRIGQTLRPKKPKRRFANLYDAVAGMISDHRIKLNRQLIEPSSRYTPRLFD